MNHSNIKSINDSSIFTNLEVLSIEGGLFELSEEQRINSIIFIDDSCLDKSAIVIVTKSSKGLLIPIENTLKRKGFNIKSTYFSNVNLIEEMYSSNKTTTVEINDDNSSLLDALVRVCVNENASDIHISLKDSGMTFKLRKDGTIKHYKNITRENGLAFLRSMFLKEDGNVDTNFKINKTYTYGFDWKHIRMRCVSIPTTNDNCVQVWRVIDRNIKNNLSIDDCGYDEITTKSLKFLAELTDGLTIVSGPTGSGKSTTLQKVIAHYTNLHRQSEGTYGKKTYTLDNVIEYQIPGATQIEAQLTAEATQEEILKVYNDILSSLLRADPDCVSMNEIRSEAEGKMLTDLVDTGRKAFVTLHAKDTFSTVKRAIQKFKFDSNVFSFNGIVNAILTQKLIPKLCPDCKVPFDINHKEVKEQPFYQYFLKNYVGTNYKNLFIKNNKGCETCEFDGNKDRKLVYELFIPNQGNKAICELIEIKEYYKAHDLWLNTDYDNGIDGISIAERHLIGMFEADFCVFETIRFCQSNILSDRLKINNKIKLLEKQNA